MNAIRLESFRSLGDTGFVELRPLTLLVGRNSSGKSSFLRFLPLLRQSVEARTTGPIQWYGDYVDFGGFDETHSSFVEGEKEIRIGFKTTLGERGQRDHPAAANPFNPLRGIALSSPIPCEVTLAIEPDPENDTVTRFKSVTLEAAGQSIVVDIDHPNKLHAVVVNGSEPLRHATDKLWIVKSELLPQIMRSHSADDPTSHGLPSYLSHQFLALGELMDFLKPLCSHTTSDEDIAKAASTIRFGTDEEIFTSLVELDTSSSQPQRNLSSASSALRALYKELGQPDDPGKPWRESIQQLDIDHPRFRAIRDCVVANGLSFLLEELDTRLDAFARSVRYSKPVRATAERDYRQQDLAVDEIDPEGRNLAVFLQSLSDGKRRNLEEWLLKEMGWKIRTALRGGRISLRIEEKGNRDYNLADVGFGFSQMLPVLIQLWSMQALPSRMTHLSAIEEALLRSEPGFDLTFAIEQPELHLHPGLQARLADTMSRAIATARQAGVRLTLVVETHSETMVNRIGHLIARGKMNNEDAAVVLFAPAKKGKGSSVRKATYGPDGYLQNWPFGFFEPS